jgi:hypothetical protein
VVKGDVGVSTSKIVDEPNQGKEVELENIHESRVKGQKKTNFPGDCSTGPSTKSKEKAMKEK